MVSLTITFYHKGIFVGPPLEYLEGNKDTMKDLDFGNFTYGKFFYCIKAATLFPFVGLFYCLSRSDLSDGITESKTEQQLADFVAATLGNGGHIDVYVEQHGYDIHDWNDIKDHEEMKMMLTNYGVANGYQLCKEKVAEGKGKEEVAEGKGKEKVAEGIKVTVGNKKWTKQVTKLSKSPSNKRTKRKTSDNFCKFRVFDFKALVMYKWIARNYVREIVSNPKISHRELQAAIREKFLINVSLGHRLVIKNNLGSTVKLDVDEVSGGKTYFIRFYVCFKAMKDGWTEGCKK
nr:calcium/proton exchanger [Tanacetum cinerariifolium]